MTTIEALSLQGVRAYSPKESQVIKFRKPLTIILGTNGSGKTTIIEALRLVTTGEFPPGTEKGKYMVYDPKIMGQTEVKAQVRLQFKTPTKKTMLAIRSMQVTQKKASVAFKQLDATIQTKNANGEHKSNSHKCTEMNTLVPALMGVSRAVLESVIFCHQEDVNWPLGKGKELKERFDDIFASTRYTKALKTIKEVKKTQDLEIKQFEGVVKLHEEYKEHADKLNKDIAFENGKLAKLDSRIREHQDEINHLDEQLKGIDQQMDAIRILNDKINVLKAQRKANRKVADEYNAKITEEYTEDDNDLKSLLDSFDSELESHSSKTTSLEKELAKKEKESKQLSAKYQQVSNQKHLLESEKNNHERRIAEITIEIESISKQFNIPFSQADQDCILKFASLLESSTAQMEKNLSDLKKQNSERLMSLRDNANSCRQEIKSHDSVITKNSKNVDTLKRNIQKLQKQVQDCGLDESTLEDQRSTVESKKSAFDVLVEGSKGNQSESEIAKVKKEISSTNALISSLGKELNQRKAEQEASFRVEQTCNEVQKLEENMHSAYSEIQITLTTLNDGDDVSAEKCANFLEKQVLKKLSNESSRLQNQLSKVERDLSAVNTKISSNDSSIKNLKKKLTQQQKKLEDNMVDVDNYETVLQEAESEAELAINDYSITKAMADMADKFKKHAQHSHKCPTCERGLNTDELQTFFELQEKKMKESPELLKRKTQARDESEKKVRSLRLLRPVIVEIKSITDKQIPKLEELSNDLEEEKKELGTHVDTIKVSIKSLKDKEEDARNILPNTTKIQELIHQIQEKQKLVEKEVAKLKSIASEGKDYNELKKQQESNQRKLEEFNNRLDALRKDKDNTDKAIQQAERDWRNEEHVLHDLEKNFQQQQHVEENLKKLQAEFETLNMAIAQAEATIAPLQEELAQREKEIAEMQAVNQSRESEISVNISNLNKAQSRIHATVEEIQRYVNENKEDALQSAIENENKISIRKEDTEEACEKLRGDIKDIEDLVSRKNDLRRNIEDNITYREKKQSVRDIEKKILAYKDRLTAIAGSDFDENEIRRMRDTRNSNANMKAKYDGSRATHASRLQQVKTELSASKYKNASANYKQALIQLTTTRLAVEDLMKYHRALEKALLKYHSMKMAEINDIIKELWMKCYRGQDVSTVAIKAELNTGKKRDSYNYRVVMKVGDVEMNMGGRCSAGQKVLASLIVRLALAEAFSVECGILALDEPTTNLDKETVASLADSLQTIIQERRDSNFQLLIITHDEEFVQRLGRSDLAETYYRVQKSPEGFSQITEERFTSG